MENVVLKKEEAGDGNVFRRQQQQQQEQQQQPRRREVDGERGRGRNVERAVLHSTAEKRPTGAGRSRQPVDRQDYDLMSDPSLVTSGDQW